MKNEVGITQQPVAKEFLSTRGTSFVPGPDNNFYQHHREIVPPSGTGPLRAAAPCHIPSRCRSITHLLRTSSLPVPLFINADCCCTVSPPAARAPQEPGPHLFMVPTFNNLAHPAHVRQCLCTLPRYPCSGSCARHVLKFSHRRLITVISSSHTFLPACVLRIKINCSV